MLICGLCYQNVYASAWYPSVYYLDENCGQSIKVFKDAIIKISKNSFLREGNCSMGMNSSDAIYLSASVLKYSMNKKFITDKFCQNESIQLVSSNNSILLGPYGYCKSTRPTGQYFLYDRGTYSYASIGKFNDAPEIDLLVSEIYLDANEGCRTGYFECSEYICIDQSLKCNGYDDCGNGHDEKDCLSNNIGSSNGYSGWEIFWIVVGSIVGFFCFCWTCLSCIDGQYEKAFCWIICILEFIWKYIV